MITLITPRSLCDEQPEKIQVKAVESASYDEQVSPRSCALSGGQFQLHGKRSIREHGDHEDPSVSHSSLVDSRGVRV